MKKIIFLLLLLTSFTMMFGQIGSPRNVRLLVKGADNSMVTGPTDGVSVTNTSTLVTTLRSMNQGICFFNNASGLIQGDTYSYDITPPACFVNQAHSVGTFVVEVTDNPSSAYYIYATPFAGVAPVATVITRTIAVDGQIPASDVVVKLTRHDVNGSNGIPGPDYIPYLEIIGSTNGTGLYSFANVPLGIWDLVAQIPCAKTFVSKSNLNLNCDNYLAPPSANVTVNTTTYGFSLGTGAGYGEILLTDCDSNYPIIVSGGTADGSIIDGTKYTVNYTYDNWGTPTTVTSPEVTSFPSYNSAPNYNNNTNRLQFIPEGYNGSEVTVNFLTQVGGSCADLIVDKKVTNLGPPKGSVSFSDNSLGWSDPSSIIGGKLIETTSGEEFTGIDNFGAWTFDNLPQGTFNASLTLTNCRVYTQENIVVTCPSILDGNVATTYSFSGADVPALTSGKVVARMLFSPDAETCPFPVFDSAATATMTDGVNTVTGTLTFDNDFVFENVPFSATPYIITAVRPCYPDVTATYTVDCNTTLYSVASNTGDPCYRPASEDGYGYTVLDYTGLSSSVAADFTVVMDMPFGTAYFSKAELSGSGGTIVGDTALGNFATFSNIPFGTYTLYLDRNCYNQKIIEGIEITCATLTAAAADTENPYGMPYELVTYTTEDAKTSNSVIISPMFEDAILADATVTLSSATTEYNETVETFEGNWGTDPAYFYDVPYATDYTYTITYPCYATQTGTLTVDCNDNVEILVEVEMSVATTNDLVVYVTPVGGLGFGVNGATIHIWNDDMSYNETLVSGGYNLFSNVPYGNINYEITKDCTQPVTGTTTIECTPGDIDALAVEIGANLTTNDLVVYVTPIGGLGFGINGATIHIWNDDMSYDETLVSGGYNLFSNLPYGEYNYEITKECTEPVTGTTTVECTPGDIDALAVEIGASFTSGQVDIDVSDGMLPIFGATIRLYNAELNYDETIEASSSINSFLNVPYGDLTYEVSYTCKTTATGTVTVACNPDNFTFVPVVLDPSTTNMLTLMIDNGTDPVDGVEVTISNEDGYTDSRFGVQGGMANFFNVPFGTITYSIKGGDCVSPATGTVTIDCNNGEANSATVSLDASTIGDLNISVTDGTEELNGAEIHVYNSDLSYDKTVTSSGYNFFKDVPYGELSYEVTMEGKTTATGTITIECALYNITEYQVVLEPALGVNDFSKNSFNAVSFPNPFADNFAIKVTSLNQDKVNIKVYDMVGRLVEQRNATVSDLETTQLGKNYPSGIYNITVTQDDNVKTLRVIKR